MRTLFKDASILLFSLELTFLLSVFLVVLCWKSAEDSFQC